MSRKPNILLFLTDDQRFDTIEALGNNEIKTPFLNELLRNGTSFTNAHIPGGTVSSVCMPSRAMLHTGRLLFHLANNGQNIPEEHALLGETLKNTGYCTFGTGKWHNGTQSFARSFDDGDDIFFWGMWDHWNVPVYDFDPKGKYEKTSKRIPNMFADNKTYTHNCNHIHLGKHSSELFCESAIKWLLNYDSDDPFFMSIALMAPHDPRSMPEEFLKMYNPESITLPQNFSNKHPFNYGLEKIRDESLAPTPRTAEVVKRHIAEYYAMITHLDHEFGKVIEALKKTGKYENTLIIFCSDNGLAVGQHGLMGKQNIYEHSVRVPLIFSGPGIPKNAKRDTLVYLLDIFPTICDLAGIEIPDTVEGISLVPSIKNPNETARKSLYLAYGDCIRGVKNKRYKLIEYRTEDLAETQLFDLYEDPLETKNLFGKEGTHQITTELRNELIKYQFEWDDSMHPTGKKFWQLFNRLN